MYPKPQSDPFHHGHLGQAIAPEGNMQEQRQFVQIHPDQLLTWAMAAKCPKGSELTRGCLVATLQDARSWIFTVVDSVQFLKDNNHNAVISLLHFRYLTENHPLYWNLIMLAPD